MERKVKLCCFLVFVVFHEFSCMPIFNEEETLKSIVISEIDLPTDALAAVAKENLAEPEKSESFVELYEKYDELYIKNSTTDAGENPMHKRSSDDDDEEEAKGEGKSVIGKVENIVDPEVRKEFELELPNSGKISEGEVKSLSDGENLPSTKESSDPGTEYDPNYAQKIVTVENTDSNVIGESIEDLKSEVGEYTTVPPSAPEIIEVVEEVFHQPKNVEIDPIFPISSLLNVQADFEPIEVVTKAPENFRSLDDESTTLVNDKFVGYQPNEDFVEPGEETTEPDNFFTKVDPEEEIAEKSAAEAIVDTLEFVGLYGKSLKDDQPVEKVENTDKEVVAKVLEETSPIPEVFEIKTEIIEVNTEFSVSFQTEKPSKIPQKASEIESSSSDKSSEESKSVEKVSKADKNSSESSEENSAKEKVDEDNFRSLDVPKTSEQKIGEFIGTTQNHLLEDLYKDTLDHEVIKKDHPVKELEEVVQRSLNDEPKTEEKLKSEETTTVGIYETFEDVVATASDGVKLTNEFRSMIDSFRGNAEEIKTVLDTDREAVSSKNLKNSLVNIAEEMTLENHARSSEISYVAISVIAFVSVAVVASLYMVLKSNPSINILW